ncbi:ESX-4 secretion system protein eccD4 [Mycobacterium avium subsp. hominissuis]|uniref:ESX-4 secretion system protein eccD4 n=1 Tax=Mycobacterium avium subsp. hominissuis TaxID=439334 RepID=A0AAI8X4G5_MYCAV|nr:ESX-4 secretion system protein eccD4 [Mycobacterium avium subsp. hominissuis]
MAVSTTGLCRVSVHWETQAVDVSLPAEIAVAELIPSLVDMLGAGDGGAGRYRLSAPGAAALDPSTTLAHNHIGDGAILVLSRIDVPLPAPRYRDIADTVSAALDATARPDVAVRRVAGATAAASFVATGGLLLVRNTFSASVVRDSGGTLAVLVSTTLLALGAAAVAHRGYRDRGAALALGAIATPFAGLAGFVAVPGVPSLSHVLLAAAAAALAAVSAIGLSGCCGAGLLALACWCLILATAALAGVLSGAPLPAVASAAGLVSLCLLGMAARASLALAGLSPRPATTAPAGGPEPGEAWVSARARRADRWLTGLLAGLSSSATVAAAVTVLAGAPRLCCLAFGTGTGALLLLRSRGGDGTRALVFAAGGIVTTAATFGAASWRAPLPGPWVAATTATLVAAALYLGCAARTCSPVLSRAADLLEWLALAALVPLTCWIAGLYGTVRGLTLG